MPASTRTAETVDFIMLDASRAAGVTVIGSVQPHWRELPARLQDNFVNQVNFTGPAPRQTHGAQGWFARPERLAEELSVARQARA